MIRLLHVSKSYGKRTILKDINYTFQDRGFYIIIGKSGEGKSTLLQILSRLDEDYQGTILWDGQRINQQKNIGFLHQSPLLFSLLTCEENLHFAYTWHEEKNDEKEEWRTKHYWKKLQLEEVSPKQEAFQLSGGEKARLALLSSLIHSPSILFCDEPTGALDKENARKLLDILKEESRKKAVILITHDQELAKQYADTLLQLKNHTLHEMTSTKIEGKKEKECTKNHPTYLPFLKLVQKRTQKKKFRFFLCLTSMSIGFTTLGISWIASSSLYQGIEQEFSSFLKHPQIEIQEKIEKSSYHPFPIEEAKNIANSYSLYCDHVGIYYLDSFHDRFRNPNQIHLQSGNITFPLPSFSLSHFNTFQTTPLLLEKDEIGLQVDEKTYRNFCVYFSTSSEELNTYLQDHLWNLVLHLEKEEWQYEDEQCFRVRYIFQGESNQILHSDVYFNEYVFETLLRFPNSSTSDMPWAIHPIYRFHSAFPTPLLDALLENEEHPKLFGQEMENGWVALYEANAPYLKKKKLEEMIFSPYFSHYMYSFSKGYCVFPEAYMAGFLDDFLLTKEKETLYSLIEELHSLPKDTLITYPDSIARGNLLSPTNSIQFSPYLAQELLGSPPKNDNEILLSSSLFERIFSTPFQSPVEIFSSYLKERIPKGDQTNQNFVTQKLLVVGTIEEKDPILYQSPEWLLHYFRDKIHIDSFSLLPYNGILYLQDGVSEESALRYIKHQEPEYIFTHRGKELQNTIRQTCNYMKWGFAAFSFITFCISAVLFALVLYLYSKDFYMDISVLISWGGKKIDALILLFLQTFLIVTSSFLLSLFQLFFLTFLSQFTSIFPFPFLIGPSQIILLCIPYFLLLIFGWMTNQKQIKKKTRLDLFLWNRKY